MNGARLGQFKAVYMEELGKAVVSFPDEYPWACKEGQVPGPYNRTVEVVVGKMMDALERKQFNKEGRALKATFKRLGVTYTYKALYEWLGGGAK